MFSPRTQVVTQNGRLLHVPPWGPRRQAAAMEGAAPDDGVASATAKGASATAGGGAGGGAGAGGAACSIAAGGAPCASAVVGAAPFIGSPVFLLGLPGLPPFVCAFLLIAGIWRFAAGDDC